MHETCPRNADTCRRRAEKGEKQPYEIGHGNIYLGQPVTLFLLTRSSLVAPRRPRVQSTRPRPTGHFVVGIPGRHAPQPTSPRGRLAFYFWIRNPAECYQYLSHSGRDVVAVVGLARGYPQHNAVACVEPHLKIT